MNTRTGNTAGRHVQALWSALAGAVAVLCLTLSHGAEETPPAPVPGTLPIGSIIAFGGPVNQVPEASGWLLCDGRQINASEYPELFRAIGTSWGGVRNSGTFNLPDLRGRFLRGVNLGAMGDGRDPEAVDRVPSAPGGNAGDQVGSAQPEAVGPHSHALTGPANAAGPGGGAEWIRFFAAKIPDPDAPVLVNTSAIQPNAGSETRPANVSVHWIIRAR